MEASEYIELLIMAREAVMVSSGSFLAAFTAYLIAVYTVGTNVTKVQFLGITFVYSVWSLYITYAAVLQMNLALDIAVGFYTEHPEIAKSYNNSILGSGNRMYTLTILVIYLPAWMMSLIYAHKVVFRRGI